MLTAWRTNSPTRPTGAVGASTSSAGAHPNNSRAIRQLTRPTLSADPPADIVGVDWNGLHRGAVSVSSGRPTAGTTAVATLTTSPFGGRCVIASPESVSSGKSTDLARDDTPGRGDTHRVRGRPQPISNRPLALNVGRTSGEHLAARTSLNTGPAQSVGTVVTSATSPHRHRNNHEEIAGEQSVYIPPA